jgi:hypothetical protein
MWHNPVVSSRSADDSPLIRHAWADGHQRFLRDKGSRLCGNDGKEHEEFSHAYMFNPRFSGG